MIADSDLINIKNIYKNTKLKKIVNVYQKKYINFLRGSLYLTDLCNMLNLEFDIDIINHPMSKYLKNNLPTYDISYSDISVYINFNIEADSKIFLIKLIHILNNCNNEIFFLCNNSYIFCKTTKNSIQKFRNTIIPKIEPNNFILEKLDEKLSIYNLKRNQYAVIHIRCGDYSMNIENHVELYKTTHIKLHQINNIVNYLKNNINKNKKYILIGDNNIIKKIISDEFPDNLLIFNTKITHLGESPYSNEESIIETLIDFYLMKYSNFTISFTIYGHGSGFSKYCSLIYNINYNEIIL